MLGYTVSVLALLVFVLNALIPVVRGLRTTVGSPCTDVCHQTSNETTPADIVCLDNDYNTTITGSNFQKCVECQLYSSYADNYTGETDVLWGLCMLFHGGHFVWNGWLNCMIQFQIIFAMPSRLVSTDIPSR